MMNNLTGLLLDERPAVIVACVKIPVLMALPALLRLNKESLV